MNDQTATANEATAAATPEVAAPAKAKKARKARKSKAKVKAPRPGNVIQPSGYTLREERLLAKVERFVARNPELREAIATILDLDEPDPDAEPIH